MRGALLFSLLCLAPPARADVVDPSDPGPVCPPMTCPPGSNSYAGSHGSCSVGCAPPRSCSETMPCERGWTCPEEEVHLCLDTVDMGHSAPTVLVGECDASGACAEGVCAHMRRCLPPPPGPVDPNAPTFAGETPPPSAPPPVVTPPAASTPTAPVAPTAAAPSPEPASSWSCAASRGPTTTWMTLLVTLLVSRAISSSRRG